ncbi:hypothetical protein [Sphingomonas mollis]|uniref:TonB C-terminal domain-containing protein n=1 Tax=Sphingomonas mollis TaxID=2795726 RepID=A0ABS0XSY5_9SPHN|nr:hypothetical protein [Sphingomonas sp. BT553]MBJ6123142.1 hypothetical protein [Sphingomonas sp. BT553]
MNRKMIVGAGLLLASAATAQQPARTVQQDFEAAAALDAGTDHAAALGAWEALEKRTKPGTRSNAIVLVRKSNVLWKLGRSDDAVAAARAGLEKLPTTDASLRGDRYDAYFTIGRVAMAALDYAGAATAFAQAEQLADLPAQKLTSLFGLIETLTFTDPEGAKAALARANTVIAAIKVEPAVVAQIARRAAVLALNSGDLATARSESQRAVKLMGGLTMQTDLNDVSARADAALALILGGQPDRAREYLAYTGAGRIPNTDFDPASGMTVPECGGDAGLKPNDMAVVEFSIADDGKVDRSTPVYAAGGGAVGLEFARAARNWSMSPEQAKQLPAFYRHNVRVELRCTTAFARPTLTRVLADDLTAWLATKGLRSDQDVEEGKAPDTTKSRSALAAAEARGDGDALTSLPLLVALMNDPRVGREETHGFAVRALSIARANAAPATASLGLALVERATAGTATWRDRDYQRAIEPLQADPLFANDAQARGALRLTLADSQKGERGMTLLRQVADDPGLKPNDPFRVGALVRIASRSQASGDTIAARQAFEKTGLEASQCALLDSPPRFLSAGGTFPEEARRWGFEGWTRTEFDVDANGRVVNQRAIVSYPAFVFTDAGVKTITGARFTKSYRPDGGLGCGALWRNIKFVMGS